MRALFRPGSVRARLTLWYASALATVLVLYAGGVYFFLRASLYEDLDRHLDEDVETAEVGFTRGADGSWRWLAEDHDLDVGPPDRWAELYALDGKRLAASSLARSAGIVPSGRGIAPRTAWLDGDPVRLFARPCRIEEEAVLVLVARSEKPLRHELAELLTVLGFGIPVAVALAGIGGYALARRALAPVAAMTEHARAITADRLSERLPVENPGDELGDLAHVFNETFARLERSFEELRRFTSDASHELRTPLTALRTVGEVALARGGDEAAYRDAIGSMLEEVSRLARLVDTLLFLARGDAGRIPIRPEALDLSELAREVALSLGVLAEEKGQSLSIEGDGPVRPSVCVDRAIFRHAVANLVDNAIQHSPFGAAIRLVVRETPDAATLEVSDSGPGIAPEYRERIFERFFRIDPGRSRDMGGTGLGLAIARWAVEANGGRIEVDSEVGRGSTFRIVLPAMVMHPEAPPSGSNAQGPRVEAGDPCAGPTRRSR